MKIGVVGVGAVGGYFGARLAAASSEVHFQARGRSLAAIRHGGLRIDSVLGDVVLTPNETRATDEPSDIGPCDVVLFCVKSYDTGGAADRLAPLLHEQTAVISLQNGIDNEQRIADRIGSKHVVGGVAYLFAHRAAPGHIRHTGGPAKIVFGELNGERSPRMSAFLVECQRAGIAAEVAGDIKSALWSKFVFICAQAGLTTATRQPIGRIRQTAETWTLFRTVLEEVAEVGRAEGALLRPDLVQQHLAFAMALEPHGRSSMYDDLAAGRRLELEALLGEVVRRGIHAGVSTPVVDVLYGLLLPSAAGGDQTTHVSRESGNLST
jgi:2-dehydropantoate 2-reductase